MSQAKDKDMTPLPKPSQSQLTSIQSNQPTAAHSNMGHCVLHSTHPVVDHSICEPKLKCVTWSEESWRRTLLPSQWEQWSNLLCCCTWNMENSSLWETGQWWSCSGWNRTHCGKEDSVQVLPLLIFNFHNVWHCHKRTVLKLTHSLHWVSHNHWISMVHLSQGSQTPNAQHGSGLQQLLKYQTQEHSTNASSWTFSVLNKSLILTGMCKHWSHQLEDLVPRIYPMTSHMCPRPRAMVAMLEMCNGPQAVEEGKNRIELQGPVLTQNHVVCRCKLFFVKMFLQLVLDSPCGIRTSLIWRICGMEVW